MLSFNIDHFAPSIPFRLNEKTLKMFDKPGTAADSPYSGVTQVLLETVRVPSPAEKMQLLEGLNKQVELSILSFNKRHGIEAES